MSINYRVDAPLERDEITALYATVGWSAYTKDPERLAGAISASLRAVSSFFECLNHTMTCGRNFSSPMMSRARLPSTAQWGSPRSAI